MANEVTLTTANDLTFAASILEQDIIDSVYANNGVINFTRRSSLAGFPSKAKDFPKTPTIAAASVAEAVDLGNTPFATSKVTITTGEAGVMITLTDILQVSDIVDQRYYVAELGKAVANKVTTDICALSSGFSNQVGSTGAGLTEANILDGIATLEALSVPGPYGMVLHPQQRRDLIEDIGTTAISNWDASAPVTAGTAYAAVGDGGIASATPAGDVGMLYGMMTHTTAAVPTANAGADRLGMIVAPNRALGYVEKAAVGVELERDASLRAVEVVAVTTYGVGEIDDASGVGVLSDA